MHKCIHPLLGGLDGYPLKTLNEDSLQRILSNLDLRTVLVRVDQVLDHLHVDLDKSTLDIKGELGI